MHKITFSTFLIFASTYLHVHCARIPDVCLTEISGGLKESECTSLIQYLEVMSNLNLSTNTNSSDNSKKCLEALLKFTQDPRLSETAKKPLVAQTVLYEGLEQVHRRDLTNCLTRRRREPDFDEDEYDEEENMSWEEVQRRHERRQFYENLQLGSLFLIAVLVIVLQTWNMTYDIVRDNADPMSANSCVFSAICRQHESETEHEIENESEEDENIELETRELLCPHSDKYK